MTSSEQVREQIARVLHASDVDGADLPFESVGGAYRLMADAILARWPVLAGVTDSMVEAGAKALHAFWNEQPESFGLPWQAMPEDRRAFYRAEARAVLEAVHGKESTNAAQ